MMIEPKKGATGRVIGLRQLLDEMSQQDIRNVLQNFSLEAAASSGFADSTDFDLVYEGKKYPPKAVFGLAAERLIGRPLTSDEFSGGIGSPCFAILQNLGFDIQPKSPPNANQFHIPDRLSRYSSYNREAISQLFEPGTTFVPQAGRWGISGIVETPKDSGNFVFMVTLGKPHEGNPYQDELTEDGFLIWESQTRHDFESSTIQKLLSHDPQEHNIYLFLRSSSSVPYSYLGLLEYFSHDPNAVNPVHFIWRIRSWELTSKDLNDLRLTYRKALDPTYSPIKQELATVKLMKADPPSTSKTKATSRKREKGSEKQTANIDWAEKDEKNRQLGLLGEKLVLQYEFDTLISAGKIELASQVKHVALYDSSAGYDILSFQPDGKPKHIEVKTTQGPANTPFFISVNEVMASREKTDTYSIYRVYEAGNATKQPKFYQLLGAVEISCQLTATNFRAYPIGSIENEAHHNRTGI